ncbi:hypothetical protein EVAR_45719_1 [Eumeta japonica]|uniref:Uncharacterized protein n=1 Tax=Eumeta variegata TaxID=151549 RepID=A0A4C1WZ61_EUMVA|nr:hypothetical protein EVAR_45719_1 [Eumeta japonica]
MAVGHNPISAVATTCPFSDSEGSGGRRPPYTTVRRKLPYIREPSQCQLGSRVRGGRRTAIRERYQSKAHREKGTGDGEFLSVYQRRSANKKCNAVMLCEVAIKMFIDVRWNALGSR